MRNRIYGAWKVWIVGFIFIMLLIPSGVLAQGKEPVKFKLFRADEFKEMTSPTPGKIYYVETLTDKEGAKNLGGGFFITPPTPPGAKPTYHYHKNRESIILMLSGEGTAMMVEGQSIPLKPGDAIFIPSMVKHIVVNHSDKESRFLEFFTYPPFWSDIIRVKE
ncbi:MAG: cupin domain-containing protein [Deltaproteobacteria bacterium]|nr:cupin domain-containing protein [Deltaproteobacteria bacterium]